MSGVMKMPKLEKSQNWKKIWFIPSQSLEQSKKSKILKWIFFSVYFLIHFGFARAGLLAETKIKTVY